MTRAVVILGAGASADFGVPILSNIFKDRYARQYLAGNPRLMTMLNDSFWFPRGHDLDSSDRSLSIEQMLTILKDWENEKGISSRHRPQASTFRKGLYVLIQRAVFQGKSSTGAHLNPLIDICRQTFDHTTWASFNWDCIFEASYYYSMPIGARGNPGLAIPIRDWWGGSTKHTFLKLHGGINWWDAGGTITYLPWSSGGNLQQKWDEYDADPNPSDRPVILEPSFYKYSDSAAYRQLGPQRDRFFDELLMADCVVIIGYSLPEMDVMARSKILTAFQANGKARWLVVDSSEQVCTLFSKVLGSRRANILQMTLAGFNNDIRTHLNGAFPSEKFL